jgi:CRP-like cAMP-binding protein
MLVQNLSRQFDVRASLPLKSENLWEIESGYVRGLTWLEDGSLLVLGLWGPGDLVGRALSNVDPYQVECLTKVVVVERSPSEVPPANAQLQYLKQVESLLLIRSHKRVDEMLLKLLGWLAKRFGHQSDHGRRIDLRLTHQDLADCIGTTRVTVTRVLIQLEQQGYIRRESLQRIVLQKDDFWHYEI